MSESNIIRRSLLISFIERYSITCLQFISVMVLARLLTPEDIGIYTVGLAIIGIAHMVRDFGIGAFVVQEKNLTREKVATALGLTIVIAWSLGLIVIAVAPVVADFYEEDAILEVTYVVALNFFIIPIGAMAPALLKRSMSFGTLLKISVGSTFVSVIVGISLAFMGFSYMSMAWASVANVTTSALLSQVYLPSKFRVFPTLRGARQILRFGGQLVGANLANEINASAADLLIGKYLGFASLGFYSRAQGYVKIYQNVIQKAVNPVVSAQIAKVHRSGEVLDTSYSTALDYITVTGWFCLGFMALMSGSIIELLYGNQWSSAALPASLMCLGACFGLPNSLARSLLVSTGQVKINFYLTLAFSVLRVLLIIVLVERGLTELLIGVLILSMVNFVAAHIIIFSKYGFDKLLVLNVLVKNALLTLVSLIIPSCFLYTPLPSEYSVFLTVPLVGAVSCLAWLAVIYAVNHPISQEITNITSSVVARLQLSGAR